MMITDKDFKVKHRFDAEGERCGHIAKSEDFPDCVAVTFQGEGVCRFGEDEWRTMAKIMGWKFVKRGGKK